MDLVILAGGMGSRFGGLKQIEPIDDNGNFIIDYSVFDAIRAGFDRVVFVIKRENQEVFKETIGKRIENKIKVEYVYQELDSFVDTKKYNILNRTKPWGTAHAILCSKNIVKDNFAIINADDFYGENSFKEIANFLKENKNENVFGMVSFNVCNTLTENGDVKRGICLIENNCLKGFRESIIKQKDNKLFSCSVEEEPCDENLKPLDKNTLVSMNLFGFTPKIFRLLEDGFKGFLEINKQNLEKCEYYIPNILTENIDKGNIHISVLSTKDKWLGLTYKSDYEMVQKNIKDLIGKKVYPKNLWEN